MTLGRYDWATMPTVGALCYIRDRGRVLLQLRRDDLFGGGLWNGPGGHVEEDESPAQAAVREVREETGLTIHDLRDHGALTFYFGDEAEPTYIVHIFSSERFTGQVQANDEGQLEWFSEERIPFDQMFPDDRHWVPHLLAGRRFEGTFRLSEDLMQIVSHELQVKP